MIDRDARNHAALSLRRLIAGQITNEDFEFSQPDTKDEAIAAVYDTAWLLYNDNDIHKLSGGHRVAPDLKREVIRWILFLDSSHEYIWPKIAMPGSDPKTRVRIGGGWRRRLMWQFAALSSDEANTFLAAGDYEAWPFASRADFKSALRSPRRLSGRFAA